MKNNKINIIFIGINNFSIPILYKIIKNNLFNIKYIISKKNKYIKLIKNICKKKKIIILLTNNILELKKITKQIINKNIYLGIIISYGFIIPKNIIKIPKYGLINIHASLLPRWRGPAPIQWTLLSNDKITGLTIIKINEKIDDGKIIYQKKIKIKKNDNYISLYNKLQKILIKTINIIILYIYKKKIKYKKQNNKYITYTKKIKKKDGLIIWNKNTAKNIESKIKAFYEWPKTFFFYKKNIIFIWSINILNKYIINNNFFFPGKILKYNKKKLIICAKDLAIEIKILQLNNKKKNTIPELFNNNPKLFKKNLILF